jgi:hypothetical protein
MLPSSEPSRTPRKRLSGSCAWAGNREALQGDSERRSAFTRKLRRAVAHIESLLPTPNAETAQAIFATLVGTLQLARSLPAAALRARAKIPREQNLAVREAKHGRIEPPPRTSPGACRARA